MRVSMERELQAALKAALAAARLCRAVQEEMVQGEYLSKEDRSPVTVADFGSQAVVCKLLREAFPQDQILAEETAAMLMDKENRGILQRVASFISRIFPEAQPESVCRWIDLGGKGGSGRHWCLDPIDGTKGFLRHDQYAIALALILEERVVLGVLACPNLWLAPGGSADSRGVLFYAVEGNGAFQMSLEGAGALPMRVSNSVLGDPCLKFCESFESGHSDHEGQARLAKALGITAPSIRMDSQAKYGLVARGEADIYLRLPNPKTPHYKEKVWDHAAGTIIIQEAGGRVSDIHGEPLRFGSGDKLLANEGVVATNGLVHQPVLEALAQMAGTLPSSSGLR